MTQTSSRGGRRPKTAPSVTAINFETSETFLKKIEDY